MYSQAPALWGRNEKICTHRTRKWHCWLSVWKEELFSPTLHSRLCSCPRESAHASLPSERLPHLNLAGRRVWHDSRLSSTDAPQWGPVLFSSVGCAGSCFGVVYYQLWDAPSTPRRSTERIVHSAGLCLKMERGAHHFSHWHPMPLPLSRIPPSVETRVCSKWVWRGLGLLGGTGFEPHR